MKVTWLGQASLLLQTDTLTILIDPYFSDAVGEMDPEKHRCVPVDPAVFSIRPDVLAFTHDHLDHYDPQTVEKLLAEGAVTVLAPGTCWQKARSLKGRHNYVLFDKGTQWTEGGIRFTAVPAVHSDPCAIGILVQAEGKTLYITGDTLYSELIFDGLPKEIDAVFLPINGVGNNMNAVDAARFSEKCGAKLAVPIHWGMFDRLDPEVFPFASKYILKPYDSMEV